MKYGYNFHGVCIATEFDLPLSPAEGHAAPDLCIRLSPGNPRAAGPPLWTSRSSGYALFREGEQFSLRSQRGEFRIRADTIVAAFDEWKPADRSYLLGSVMALWFELRGSPVLHASCVSYRQGTIALAARSGGGKSTLATSLLTRGHSLVSDDILPIEFDRGKPVVHPSAPCTRLWPDVAEHLFGGVEDFERVVPDLAKRQIDSSAIRPNATVTTSAPLTGVFLLDRQHEQGERVDVVPVPAAEALVSLVAQSYHVELLNSLPRRRERLAKVADVVRSVPVHRVTYASGLDRLEDACRAIASVS